MSSPIWAYLFGAFLILHGLGHAAGITLGNRVFGVLWLLGLAGFVLAGLAFLGFAVPREWWRPLTVASAVISIFLIVLFWTSVSGSLVGGPKSNALIANIGILLAVLWWHWPAPLTRVP